MDNTACNFVQALETLIAVLLFIYSFLLPFLQGSIWAWLVNFRSLTCALLHVCSHLSKILLIHFMQALNTLIASVLFIVRFNSLLLNRAA